MPKESNIRNRVLGVVSAVGLGALVAFSPSDALSFDSRNLLSMSAGDYAALKEKSLTDYNAVGVQGYVKESRSIYTDPTCPSTMRIPEGTEVVVNYEMKVGDGGLLSGSVIRCYGTALIPKGKPANDN